METSLPFMVNCVGGGGFIWVRVDVTHRVNGSSPCGSRPAQSPVSSEACFHVSEVDNEEG